MVDAQETDESVPSDEGFVGVEGLSWSCVSQGIAGSHDCGLLGSSACGGCFGSRR